MDFLELTVDESKYTKQELIEMVRKLEQGIMLCSGSCSHMLEKMEANSLTKEALDSILDRGLYRQKIRKLEKEKHEDFLVVTAYKSVFDLVQRTLNSNPDTKMLEELKKQVDSFTTGEWSRKNGW
jgi:D-mannonate dehydratase